MVVGVAIQVIAPLLAPLAFLAVNVSGAVTALFPSVPQPYACSVC